MKHFISCLILTTSLAAQGQNIKISNLTTSTASGDSAWVPVVIGGATRKMYGIDLSKDILATKANIASPSFTGNATFTKAIFNGLTGERIALKKSTDNGITIAQIGEYQLGGYVSLLNASGTGWCSFFSDGSYINAGLVIGAVANPAASSILDLRGTTKGFLPPRMTEAQKNAISSPAEGLMIYQTDGTKGWYGYNGSAWVILN